MIYRICNFRKIKLQHLGDSFTQGPPDSHEYGPLVLTALLHGCQIIFSLVPLFVVVFVLTIPLVFTTPMSLLALPV